MTKKMTPKRPTIRSAYSEKLIVNARQGGPSRTKQSFKNETDLNFLVDRYKKTGQVPASVNRESKYGYAPSLDFQEALELVQNARTMFSELPAAVRQNFENNPANLLAFVENSDNGPEQYAAMGLTEAPDTEAPPVYPTAAATPGEPYQGSDSPPVSNPEKQHS